MKKCKCGASSWNRKMWTTVCTRCNTALPYRLSDVEIAEVLWPCRGIELIKEALK